MTDYIFIIEVATVGVLTLGIVYFTVIKEDKK